MDPRVIAACWLQVDPALAGLLWVGPNQMVTVGPIQVITPTRAKGNEKLRADYKRIAEHVGKYTARVAVARKLLTLVFYAMRDGEVRCLETAA